MKKILSVLATLILVLAVLPSTIGVSTGGGVDIEITPEEFDPMIWLCDSRVVYDDYTEPGRVTGGGDELLERMNNYAFEGEQIKWEVLVMDKNGVEKIEDVYVTVDDEKEVNCEFNEVLDPQDNIDSSCNARIDEEKFDFVPDGYDNVFASYTCTLTVETPESDTMQGEVWIVPVVTDLDGADIEADEWEKWFLNPIIGLAVEGDVLFDDVRPGTSAYSSTITVSNDGMGSTGADEGSGVILDMFISGTDFYDNDNYGTKCPTSNQLSLSAFRYYATNGAYSTSDDSEIDSAGSVVRDSDDEGYVNIEYGIGFNNPSPFYDNAEIIQAGPALPGGYYGANLLAQGAEMSITFRLDLPVPCNADNFDDGDIYFWGEAV